MFNQDVIDLYNRVPRHQGRRARRTGLDPVDLGNPDAVRPTGGIASDPGQRQPAPKSASYRTTRSRFAARVIPV